MAWNRPHNRDEDTQVSGNFNIRSHRVIWSCIGSIFAIAVFAFLLFHFLTPEKTSIICQSEQLKPAVSKIEIPSSALTNLPVQKVHKVSTYRDEKGVLRYKGGLRAPDPTKPPPPPPVSSDFDSNGRPLWKRSIFKNQADREIERLLTLEPGRPLIGTVRYDKRFETAFRESLKTPIIIAKDDTEDVARLKRAMIDAKQEICDRLAQGEKLGDILQETKSELERLAKYRRDVERMAKIESSREGITIEEAKDLVDAANKMLHDNGIAPIRNGALARHNFMLQRQKKGKAGNK